MHTLIYIITNIQSFDENGIIYATKPWARESIAFMANEKEDDPDEIVHDGTPYFLEVCEIARIVEDEGGEYGGDFGKICDRVIEYATSDM